MHEFAYVHINSMCAMNVHCFYCFIVIPESSVLLLLLELADSCTKDPLYRAICKLHGKLSQPYRERLVNNLQKRATVSSKITFGTMFSGSDLIVLVFLSCSCYWYLHFNISIEFVHLYCVETDDWKRDWVRTVWVSVKFAFQDATQLADKGWRGFNYLSDKEGEVPYCDISFQGFECDSVSTLQSLRSAFVDCVKNRIGKTGTTCSAVLERIAISRSRINFIENVKAIGQQNLKHIQDIANSVGFYHYCLL